MKRVGGVAAAVSAAGIALVGCGEGDASSSPSPSTPIMKTVAESCSDFPRDVLSADAKSATIDTEGDDDVTGEDVAEVGCFLRELKAPDYVSEHISSTRAMDGQQTDEWDDYEARWTYHPDDGLQITFIDRS